LDNNKNDYKPDKTPYEILGVTEGADFEDIQKARDKKVKEAGDDIIAKAKIESSFDQLLMGSLKARQSGSISFEAQNASQKENKKMQTINSQFPLLSKIKNLSKKTINNTQNYTSSNSEKNIDQLPTKLSLTLIFLILLFLSPDSYNRLLLSISTLILTYVQIKSGKRFLSSLGWSVAFLSLGLIFGGLIETNSLIQEVSTNSLSQEKIQSIPAILILWLGIIFL
tara:strand:- start:141 stop:815 length:675 start_codon:yes stop_codon:yes gene_type:complete